MTGADLVGAGPRLEVEAVRRLDGKEEVRAVIGGGGGQRCRERAGCTPVEGRSRLDKLG